MKLLLRENIRKLGIIGDIVEVTPGYARNYLIPQGLATQPTKANVRKVEQDKAKYLEKMARERADLEARASLLDGKEVTISARANEEGTLYGSIGPAQIAAAMAEASLFVEVEHIVLDEPIHRLDKYEVELRFDEDVKAAISVWVVPVHDADKHEEPSAEVPTEAPEGDSDDANPAEE